MATKLPAYVSNPLRLIGPSATALGINFSTLIAFILAYLGAVFITAGGFITWALSVFAGAGIILKGIGLLFGSFGLVLLIALGLLFIPAISLTFLAAAKGEKLSFKEAINQAKKFVWRSLGINVLTILAVIGGLILLIVPGLIIMAWFSLAQFALVSEDLGAVASLKRSRELVRGRVWEVWGLMVLPNIFLILPIMGTFASTVISVILAPVFAIRYLQLATTKPKSLPKVHWVNYAIIVLALVGMSISGTINYQQIKEASQVTQPAPVYTY